MPDRIAIKRLTESDLTFFESQFRLRSNLRQKAINLNRDVFVNELYPILGEVTAAGREMPIGLTVHGPGTAGAYRLSRSITKAKESYKNWRLNGEFVRDPELEPNRFERLAPGDLAVMEFIGDPEPKAMSLVLISMADDVALHAELTTTVSGSRRTMVCVSRSDLGDLVNRASVLANHPIRLLLHDIDLVSELADAAIGDPRAAERARRRAGRPISAEELLAAGMVARRIGDDGEALAQIYLEKLSAAGEVRSFTWVSRENAVSAWDFEVQWTNGSFSRVDAKSTSGLFDRPIHMSGAEIEAAADENVRYDIWRLYEVSEEGANLSILEKVGPLAMEVMTGLKLPVGVRPDSFSIDPASIDGWGPVHRIVRPDEPD